jgi:hypothetical protein
MDDLILRIFGDHGAESSRRDLFQDHYAAQWCIEMLTDPTITEIICEYGEDLVINRSESYELRQVKTRQESREDWDLKEVLPIIAKTLAMVPYFSDVGACAFVSNDGAKGELYNLKALLNRNSTMWSLEDAEKFESFCTNHCPAILKRIKEVDPASCETSDGVREKLRLVKVETDLHHMEHIQDTNIRRLRLFIETKSEVPSVVVMTDGTLAEMYQSIMNTVGRATTGRTREEKTIRREQVLACIKDPQRQASLYRAPTLDEIEQAPGQTILEKKANLGGFSEGFIRNARDARVTCMVKAREWDFALGSSIIEDAEVRVRDLWADCYDESSANAPGEAQLGRDIWKKIRSELPKLVEHYANQNLPFVDEFFLKGTLWNLTSECKAYWSQKPPA